MDHGFSNWFLRHHLFLGDDRVHFVVLVLDKEFPGRGSAWLERLHGVQEVPSSNLGAPIFLNRKKNEKNDPTGLGDWKR